MDNKRRQYAERQDGPRSTRERQRARGRFSLWLLIICFLLVINLFFSVHLQMQLKTVSSMLNRIQQSQGAAGNPGNGTVAVQEPSPASGDGFSERTDANGQNTQTEDEKREEQDYVTLCGLSQVDPPAKRTAEEVLERLEELSADSDIIADICRNASDYPAKMLEALANNPEMADFVAGYLQAERKSCGTFTEKEKEEEYPLFLQWDPRWGYAEYGDYGNIGTAGCGPTCLSMVLFYLLGEDELTPDYIADYSMENGYYVRGTGTAWALMEDFPSMLGVDVCQLGKSEETMKKALDEGSLLICSMGPGDFTAGGHFIVMYGYDRNGFKVNDSNCVARSRKRWTYDEIKSQIKQVWAYSLVRSGDNKTAVDYFDKDAW